MKKQILLIGLVILAHQFSLALTNVKDLKINCSMKAKVTDVLDVSYSSGKPALGRFPGSDPSVHFKASLEIISSEPGCEILNSKYEIHLDGLIANAGYTAGQSSDVEFAYALKNKTVDLKLNQYISYIVNEEYLPLFPQVHKEMLSLNFKTDKVSGGVPLEFDLLRVYSTAPIEKLSDIEKMSLAEKVSQYVFAKVSYIGINFEYHSLLLHLEPEANNLKKTYALLIWKLFNEYKQSAKYTGHFLQFHVGSDGSYYGKPLALTLNKISHLPNAFSSAEIVQLLTDFPTWILAGYNKQECLNFSAENLEAMLENLSVKLPVMSKQEKYYLKDPINQITGKVHYVTNCTEGKVSVKAKALAQSIQEVLN